MFACGFWPLCPFHILISPLSRSLDRWRRIFGIVWPFETVVSSIFFPCLDMFSDYFAPQMWHQTRKYDHVKSSLRSNEPLWQYSHNVNGNQTQTKKSAGTAQAAMFTIWFYSIFESLHHVEKNYMKTKTNASVFEIARQIVMRCISRKWSFSIWSPGDINGKRWIEWTTI